MLRIALIVLTLILLVSVISLAVPAPTVAPMQMQVLEEIRQQAKLTVLSVSSSQIITQELRGWTGGVKACVIAIGEVQIGSDLTQAAFTEVDTVRRQLILALPLPQVLGAQLDLQRTQVYAVDRTGAWQWLPGATREADIVGQTLKRAEEALMQSMTPEQQHQAKQHTQKVLTDMLAPLDWHIQLVWTSDD